MDNAPEYVIEMLHITKEFPGIKANDDITLQLRRGEIHALLGENGAGKSASISRTKAASKRTAKRSGSTIPTTPPPCISVWSINILS